MDTESIDQQIDYLKKEITKSLSISDLLFQDKFHTTSAFQNTNIIKKETLARIKYSIDRLALDQKIEYGLPTLKYYKIGYTEQPNSVNFILEDAPELFVVINAYYPEEAKRKFRVKHPDVKLTQDIIEVSQLEDNYRKGIEYSLIFKPEVSINFLPLTIKI